ncbi:pseudouridine synthase [Sodiomyces alkalinus F11]|uniref:tRNA pseudouridine synthase 1 n=1 Tax=Sodiomyces alkalinus (strain CBS 110278 / VKM F-3762 / F11) TaxID=1314773 RepID=A0A3N2PUH7_SODAK|nr:pseudouridine synthase [Sodiomyces alkalinus F11]ROT38163.1 pseudouridine synthase [Sodiomyces alkalinus F11]
MADKRKKLSDDRQAAKRRKLNENGEAGPAQTEQKKDKWKQDGEPRPKDPRKANPFSTEEIAAEERRPKRKVAVMIGYSGTGYKGMQINWGERTIEGDIFKAFVAAGAIAKANADDPKKSSLARCARTDKGVHAAGNVISLKLIIEDENIVDKINASLPPQIRVWGLQRTNNAFSCYQSCDSRWYEYLMPTYSLLPPHPDSYLWKKVVESAKEHGTYDDLLARQGDVQGFWDEVEEKSIKPMLAKMDPKIREVVLERLHSVDDDPENEGKPQQADNVEQGESAAGDQTNESGASAGAGDADQTTDATTPTVADAKQQETGAAVETATPAPKRPREPTAVDLALRDLKQALIKAKRAYRFSPDRLQRLQDALNQYVGTNNFHNYTVQKSFKDPSAKRHIKSFDVNMKPIQIRDTQWVSIKVHGQSFMMHQIRKMVSMATLLVRFGVPVGRIKETYGATKIAIPKAPGLGLLLERPVFEGYNRKAVDTLGKDPIDFSKYDDKIQEFKDKEIYQRIFEVEEKENIFHVFFQQVDNFKSDSFLWLTDGGIAAGMLRPNKEEKGDKAVARELGDEDEDPEGGEG